MLNLCSASGWPGMSLKHASKFDLDQCRPVMVGLRCATQQLRQLAMRVVRLSVFFVLLAIPVTAQDMPLPPHSAPCQYGQASVDTLGEWRSGRARE